MHKCSFIRSVAVLLILCLLSMSLPIYGDAAMPVMKDVAEQDAESRAKPGLPTLDYVRWGENISGTTVKKAIRKGQSLHMQDMGLNPTACANGTVNNSFSWTSSNPSVAAVNAATGKITALEVGVVNIIGTSPFGSQHGQLTLILHVIDNDLYELSMVALCGDTFLHNTGFSAVSTHMAELNIVGDAVRTYGLEIVTDRMTVDTFASYLETSRIFYFRGHGSRTAVKIDINGSSSTYFTTSYINPLPTNIFSYCELVMYDACSTAEGGENATNLVTVTKNHGAETVVGFQALVVNSEMDRWDECFFKALANGSTVEAACASARRTIEQEKDERMLNDDGIFGSSTYVVAGNKYNTIEPYEED